VVVSEKQIAEGVVNAEIKEKVEAGKEYPKVQASTEATIKPEALDLESITFLVKKSKVKDAAALEKKINTPKEKLNNVDIDGDGKVDKIVIVETKQDDGVIVFELQAIPSKTKDKDAAVVVAYVHFTPDKTSNVLIVKATYAPVIIGYDTIVYDYTVPIVFKYDVIIVSGGGGFYGWLYTVNRPAFYGVVIYDYDPYPVFVIDVGYHDGGCWPPGHCKHGKWKGGHGGKHGGKHGKWH